MIAPPSVSTRSTRDRLAAEALRLFAEKGFKETTVGEIERAAGLQPRRGALYRHFESKEALLEAAAALHLERLERALLQVVQLPEEPSRTALAEWARWFLAEMDAERELFRVLEQDGDRLVDLRDTVRERVIDAGHLLIAEMIRSRRGRAEESADPEALAALIVGPLANHRRTAWTFGAPPAGVTDERLVDTWSAAVEAMMRHRRTWVGRKN